MGYSIGEWDLLSRRPFLRSLEFDDISLSGLGVYADHPVPPQETVTVTVNFISVDGEMYAETLRGTVIYGIRIGDFFFIGIEFDDFINPEGQPLLYKHLDEVLVI